jgi:hypothetical protein
LTDAGKPDLAAAFCISLERLQTCFRTISNSGLESFDLDVFKQVKAVIALTRIFSLDTNAPSLVANEPHERMGFWFKGQAGWVKQ